VSVSTIQKMVESGKLRAWRTQGGHRRIAETDVKSFHREGIQAAAGAPRKSLSILIVEDNPTMAKAYAKVATQWGTAVELSFAVDAVSALLQIAQRLPQLVITDLAMTPFDGFHLIRTLRAAPELADTRVLVVTGLSDQEIAERGGLDDRTVCYRKPLSFERLGGYVDARLQDRQHHR
jgi:excisionase family DNA binding protein